MHRPASELTGLTVARLDAAIALGAHETWVDRDVLGLPEPSPLGRWLCVLELPGSLVQAAGSSGRRADAGAEEAACHALARFDKLTSLVERVTPHSPRLTDTRAPGSPERHGIRA